MSKKVILYYNIGSEGIGNFFYAILQCYDFCIEHNFEMWVFNAHPIRKYIKFKQPIIETDEFDIGSNYKTVVREAQCDAQYDIYIMYVSSFSRIPSGLVLLKNLVSFSENILKHIPLTDNYTALHLHYKDSLYEKEDIFHPKEKFHKVDMSLWFEENKNDNLFISCDVNEIREEYRKYCTLYPHFSENEFFNCLVEYYILAHSDKIYHINNSTFAKVAALYNNTSILDLNKNLIFKYINDKHFKIEIGIDGNLLISEKSVEKGNSSFGILIPKKKGEKKYSCRIEYNVLDENKNKLKKCSVYTGQKWIRNTTENVFELDFSFPSKPRINFESVQKYDIKFISFFD